MKFYIDFQGGSGWEDITQYVRDNLSVTNRACSDDYKHAVNLLDFELTYESTIFLRLHSTLGYVLVRVLEDDDLTPIFVGRFIPAIDTKYDGIVNNQFVSLTASDYTSRLDIEMEEFVAENCHIMNPADKPNSIVHLLFTHLGLAHSLLDPSVSIMDEVGAATADDASNALDFLSTLLYEYGWVCNWSRAGLFSPIQWIQDDGSTTDFTFDDNNVIGSIQETSKEIELEAAKVYWYGLGTRTNNRIYTESLEYDEDGDFEGYPILRETYFPDEANVMDDTKVPPELQKVEQEYQDVGIRYGVNKYIDAGYAQNFALEHADFTRILVTKNHVISDEYDPGLTRDITVFGNKKAQIRYYNPNATSRQLYYMHINADTVFTKSKCSSLVENVASTKRVKEYDSSYLFTSAAADKLAKALAMTFYQGRYNYKIDSETAVEEGTYVTISMSNGLVATGLVLERVWDNLTNIYSYSIRSYNANYLPVTARTVRRASLSVEDGITIGGSGNKATSFDIVGSGIFYYQPGETTPINTQITLVAEPVDSTYVPTSYQWYYRTVGGLDTILVGETASTLDVDYNEAWFYSGVPIILLINGNYAYTTKIYATESFTYLGDLDTAPLHPNIGDWFFYVGTTGGSVVQYTMYFWSGSAWVEDTSTDRNATTYNAYTNYSVLKKTMAGVYTPSTVTVGATFQKGMSGDYGYAGRFIIAESADNASYSDVYTSSGNESTHTHTPGATAISIRVRLYAAGGTSTLLEEFFISIVADSTVVADLNDYTPKYLGASATEPVSPNNGDWFLYTGATGGGFTQYNLYQRLGAAWYVDTDSGHLASAFTDLIAVAGQAANTLTIVQNLVANTALINELVADTAFIDELSTVTQRSAALTSGSYYPMAQFDWNDAVITLRDALETKLLTISSAALQSYYGKGVQQRSVKVSKDGFEFFNSPVGGPDVLCGGIGRGAIGESSILLAGDFRAKITTTFNTPVVIYNGASSYAAMIQTADGTIRVAWRHQGGSGYLREMVWNASTLAWGTSYAINSASSYAPSYIQYFDGTLKISYVGSSVTTIVERTWGGSSWGPEVDTGLLGSESSYAQTRDGSGILVFRKAGMGTSGIIQQSTWNGSSWGTPIGIGTDTDCNYPAIFQTADMNKRLIFYKANANQTVERMDYGAGWTGETVLGTGAFISPKYYQDVDGILYLTYNLSTNLTRRIWSGSAWGDASTLVACGSYAFILVTASGDVRLVYARLGDEVLTEMISPRYATLGAGIIESGSNANGSYRKFSDGTMEQWGTTAVFTPTWSLVAAEMFVYLTTVIFPLSFHNVEYTYTDRPRYASNVGMFTGQASARAVGSIDTYVWRVNGNTSINIYVEWRAIGRWRA